MSHHLLSASLCSPVRDALHSIFFANQGSLIGQKAPELNNQLQTPWGSELILVFFCFQNPSKSTHFLGTHFSLLQHKSVISLVPSRDFWLHSTWEHVLLSPARSIYISEELNVEWRPILSPCSRFCFLLALFLLCILFHFMEEEKMGTGLRNLIFVRLYWIVSRADEEELCFAPKVFVPYVNLTCAVFHKIQLTVGKCRRVDLTISAATRRERACKPDIAYGKLERLIYSSIKHDIYENMIS